MRYLSLFSGIEAASVAWEPLGWEPVAFCEIDAFPSAVLAHRYPEVPNLGDVTEADWSDYAAGSDKHPDLIVGGSPCQSFSIAGNREGLAGASGLMFEYIRAVREIRPRWFVWENVPGALSSENGEAFRQLLSEMDACGYGLAWRVLDAQFFGVPQRRERVFLVGCLGDAARPAEVLLERESLRWDPPSSREKRKELAARAGRRADANRAAGFAHKVSQGAGSIGFEDEQAPTLLAGRNDAVALAAKTLQVRCGCAGGGKGALVQDDMSATLSTSQTQTVFAPVYAIDCATTPKARADVFHTLRHGGQGGTNDVLATPVTQYGDVAGTLTARHDSSPCADRGANVVAAPVCLGDDNAKASCDVDMCGALKVGGSAPVVAATGFVAWSSDPQPMEETAPTLTVGRAGDSSAMARYDVRRLTPTECERLQGFPDGWTKVPYRGKPADECPDTPRYKACGNSMAVPVMRWIGERIEAAEMEEECE